jgi:hypothetical protein
MDILSLIADMHVSALCLTGRCSECLNTGNARPVRRRGAGS